MKQPRRATALDADPALSLSETDASDAAGAATTGLHAAKTTVGVRGHAHSRNVPAAEGLYRKRSHSETEATMGPLAALAVAAVATEPAPGARRLPTRPLPLPR